MRILIFHGYLLRGTGSNIYNAALTQSLVAQGHEVHLFCQERNADDLDWVDAIVDWDDQGARRTRTLRQPARATIYRPNIGKILPVYVFDRYEHFDARLFQDLSEQELDHYLNSNIAAVNEVVREIKPDFALANHLVMGPVIINRALIADQIPYVVKIHGSALEYTVKPHPQQFMPYAREGLEGAKAILVGSDHTARSLWEAIADPDLPTKTFPGPPGVDTRAFILRSVTEQISGLATARDRLIARSEQPQVDSHPSAGSIDGREVDARGEVDQPTRGSAGDQTADGPASAFESDPAESARALSAIDPETDRVVIFVGKLIASKGVHLLLAAWPLVLEQFPTARLVIVGFGAFSEGLAELERMLTVGELGDATTLQGESGQDLHSLKTFFDSLDVNQREQYVHAASNMPERVSWVGRLEHSELVDVLPLAEAIVVPSIFPESFGMVLAEGAACGAFPIVANHSGLAQVVTTLGEALPQEVRPWLSFDVDDQAVESLAQRITTVLDVSPELRTNISTALSAAVGRTYSWDQVAHNLIEIATCATNK